MLGAGRQDVRRAIRSFQIVVLAHGASMALMAVSNSTETMNTAQAIAGIMVAALVPTLVVLIAAIHRERQW